MVAILFGRGGGVLGNVYRWTYEEHLCEIILIWVSSSGGDLEFLSPEDVRVFLNDVRCQRSIPRIGIFPACILATNIKVH